MLCLMMWLDTGSPEAELCSCVPNADSLLAIVQVPMLYFGLAGYLSLVWFGYPIVWGFAKGSDSITVTAEVRFCPCPFHMPHAHKK